MMDSLIEPDYKDAFGAWRFSPSPQTSTALLKQVQPVLESAVRNYGGAKPSPTLRGRAKVLALSAFKTYDPQRGPLERHLYSNLRRLQRHAAQENQIIRVPERVAMDRQYLDGSVRELSDRLGREPSDGEIADFTGFSVRRLAHVRQLQPVTNQGRLSAMPDGGGDDMPSIVPGQNEAEDAWIDFIYHDLGPVDQAILDHSLGRGRPRMPTGRIAQMLGITPSAVSQRAAKIQKLIDERSGGGF